MKTETENNGRPTIEADLRDAQAEVRRLEEVNRELLKACKRALVAIEALPPRTNEDRYEPLMQLAAAIAKAKGKA